MDFSGKIRKVNFTIDSQSLLSHLRNELNEMY